MVLSVVSGRPRRQAAAELADKRVATARAERESLAARIAAEKAKYGVKVNADTKKLALAAGRAERELALCQAQEQKAAGEQELAAGQHAPFLRQIPSPPSNVRSVKVRFAKAD